MRVFFRGTHLVTDIKPLAPTTERQRSSKAVITPDDTISGSYDWLRLGQGVTDRQCLLRSPAAACGDRSILYALSRYHERLENIDGKSHRIISCDYTVVVAINDRCYCARRPIV